MRNACCTCGAGWTSNAFAWDEYINPRSGRWLTTGGIGKCPRGVEVMRRVGGSVTIFARAAGRCLLRGSLLMLAIAGCLLW